MLTSVRREELKFQSKSVSGHFMGWNDVVLPVSLGVSEKMFNGVVRSKAHLGAEI